MRKKNCRGTERKSTTKKFSAESVAKRLLEVFSEEQIDETARQSGFMQRKRKLAPKALLIACISALGSGDAEWLADILRALNKLTGREIQYKPFHNQLSKEKFPEFLRRVLEQSLSKLAVPNLESIPDAKLAAFKDIIVHDGTSLTLKDELADVWPGRFTKKAPAAIELHVTMSVFENNPLSITLTADKEAERVNGPRPEDLGGCLLLEDRGYQSREFFGGMIAAGSSFIIRGTKDIRPTILRAYDTNGRRCRRLRRLEGKKLNWRTLPRETVDLDIQWGSGSTVYNGRLVAFYLPGKRNKKNYTYLHTNLDRGTFSAEEIGMLYRLRWQIELMFKEWKSYANLCCFDTIKAPIAEGLIWVSLITATLKRSLAHFAQHYLGVELSTDRVAKSARLYLDDILKAILRLRPSPSVVRTIRAAFSFLGTNARRAHPNRDRHKGRLSFGVQPIGVENCQRS